MKQEQKGNKMKTTEQKLDDLIDIEIENLTSLCSHDDYHELYQIILNQFGYKDLTENEIKEQYEARFDMCGNEEMEVA